MAQKGNINQAKSEERQKAEDDFTGFMQDILERSYDAESVLRGIQATGEALMENFETDIWEPIYMTRMSLILQQIIENIGDKALEAEQHFYAHLKIRTAPVRKSAEGRT